MSRLPLQAGNWKMNLDHLEAIQLVQRLGYHLDDTDYDRTEVVVCPAFTALRSVQTLIEGDRLRIGLGAQDCHWEESGSFTGAVSPGMLAKLDVSYVVCGHSERRRLFGETDDVVNRKVRAVLAHGMTPILCVGESEEQRDQGRTESVVVGQVEACLDGVEDREVAGMVIAYEPVWAIGTGRTAEPGEAGATCGVVRAAVAEHRGADAAEALRVQYGGSVKPGNIEALMRQADIDGTLVGGASLDPDDFAVICRWHRL